MIIFKFNYFTLISMKIINYYIIIWKVTIFLLTFFWFFFFFLIFNLKFCFFYLLFFLSLLFFYKFWNLEKINKIGNIFFLYFFNEIYHVKDIYIYILNCPLAPTLPIVIKVASLSLRFTIDIIFIIHQSQYTISITLFKKIVKDVFLYLLKCLRGGPRWFCTYTFVG